MTLVIGFRFPEMVLLGADTRSVGQNDGVQDDDTEKVIPVQPFGHLTAAGQLQLIRMIALAIEGDGDEGLVAERIGPAFEHPLMQLTVPENDPGRVLTKWLASGVQGADRNTAPTLHHVSAGDNFIAHEVPENSFHVLWPGGITDAQKVQLSDLLNARWPAVVAADAATRRDECAVLMLDAVALVNGFNATVSNRVQVGVQTADGMQISNLAGTAADLAFADC
jgi:hypothetical protein